MALDQINLHFLAFYTRGLIKKGKKCEKLSRFFVGMENFTFREVHVDEKSMENRSVSLFCRLVLEDMRKSGNRALVQNKKHSLGYNFIVYHYRTVHNNETVTGE